MSIFGKIKHKAHHVANKAKHTVSHAADEAKHKAEDAAKHAAEAAKKELEEVASLADKAFDSIKGKVEHLGEEAVKDIQHAIDQAKGDINHVVDQAKSSVEHTVSEAESKAKDLVEQGEKDLKDAAEAAKDEMLKDLKAVEKAAVSESAHIVLEAAVDVIEALSPDEIPVQVGPVCVVITNPVEKIEHFVKWGKNPPHDRETWIQFVKDLLPQSLTIVIGIGVGLLVQSDDAKVEVQPTWYAENILDKIDDILEKAGIN